MSASTRPMFALVRFGCAAVLAAATTATVAERAFGQTATMTAGVKIDGTTPVDVSHLVTNLKLANQLRSVVTPFMQVGKALTGQDETNFDLYIVFKVAELTLPATDPRDTPDRRRATFKSREMRMLGQLNVPQDLHERANQLLLKNLVPLIGNAQYSMDARYNAMLLLGSLDKVEPNSTEGRVGEPLAAAEPLMLAAAQAATLPEVLRIGALVGLARHSEMKISPDDYRQPMANEALRLLTAKEPLEGYSANGHHWARKLALQIVMGLARSGAEVNTPAFVEALAQILADETQPLFLRRDAALAFGYIDPSAITAATKVKPADVCKGMANLTLAVMKAGQPRFDPTAPVDLSKPEDVFQTPNEESKLAFANSVGYYLNCVAVGLGGRELPMRDGSKLSRGLLKAVTAGDPTYQIATTLLNTHVNALVTAVSKPNPDSNRLLSDLESKRGPLEQFIEQNALALPAGGAAPAGAAPAGNGGGVPVGATGALAAPVAPR